MATTLFDLYIILLGWEFSIRIGPLVPLEIAFSRIVSLHRHPASRNLEPLDWRQRFGGGLSTHPSLKKLNKLDSGELIEAASAFVLYCIVVFRSPGSAVNQHDGLCNVLPLLLRVNR